MISATNMTVINWPRLRRFWPAGVGAMACLVIFVAAIGRSPGGAMVSGRVTYKGKTVVIGSVVVVGADGRAVTAPITADGTYQVTGVAPGLAQLGVLSRDPGQAQLRSMRIASRSDRLLPDARPPVADRKSWFSLPKQYEDPATSGLTATVGKHTIHDITIP